MELPYNESLVNNSNKIIIRLYDLFLDNLLLVYRRYYLKGLDNTPLKYINDNLYNVSLYKL